MSKRSLGQCLLAFILTDPLARRRKEAEWMGCGDIELRSEILGICHLLKILLLLCSCRSVFICICLCGHVLQNSNVFLCFQIVLDILVEISHVL